MQLLLVRHAIAVEAAEAGGDDDARPLSTRGRRRFEPVAAALAALVPDLAQIASSPLRRARETADLVAAAMASAPERMILEALRPGGAPADVVKALAPLRHAGTVALIGHEPSLSALTSHLLAGADRSFLRFKKGGAALLELTGRPRRGSATLVWLLTPAQLRALAP
jgi:phosphohistidine phosphatase